MVIASDSVYLNDINLRFASHNPGSQKYKVSIVICTYNRQESLNETLWSLSKQTFKDFETILITELGNLSELRDKGLRSSVGDIVCFIDDDVYCPPTWLQSVVEGFREGIVGVSGPTIISEEFRNNRDLFKYKWAKRLYDIWFIGESAGIPGKLSKCGAPSTNSNDEGCSYKGEVDFLEACNMSVKRKEALDVGGFDYGYYKTSEWCEVDLSKKLKSRGTLFFYPEAMLYHKPSKAGVYKERLSTKHRWENFCLFQRKWIKPSLQRHLYWVFIWTFFKLKELRMI